MELNVLKDKVIELETTLSELKVEIEKKENEIKDEKIEKVWKPKRNEKYYTLYSSGAIFTEIWTDSSNDNNRYNLGHCFKTEGEVIKEINKRILLVELERWALENNEEVIDWSNESHYKHSIYYNHRFNKLEVENVYINQFFQLPYFTSKKLAQQAIDIFGDRLIELVFKK